MASLALVTTCLVHRHHRVFYRRLSLPPQVSGLPIRKSSRSTRSSSSIVKRLYLIKARMNNQHVAVKPVFLLGIYALFGAFSYFLRGSKRVAFVEQYCASSQDSRIETEEPGTSQGKVEDAQLLKIRECRPSMSRFLQLEPEEMEYHQAATYAKSRVQNLDFAWKAVEEMMREDSGGQEYTCMGYWKAARALCQRWISTYKQHHEWIETTANLEAASKERNLGLHRQMLSIANRSEKKRERIMPLLLEEAPGDSTIVSDDLLLTMDWSHMKDYIRRQIKKLDRDEEEIWNNLLIASKGRDALRKMYQEICDSKNEYVRIEAAIDAMEKQADSRRISHMMSFKNFYVQNEIQESLFYRVVELLLKGGRGDKN